jgi:hypothetical protein
MKVTNCSYYEPLVQPMSGPGCRFVWQRGTRKTIASYGRGASPISSDKVGIEDQNCLARATRRRRGCVYQWFVSLGWLASSLMFDHASCVFVHPHLERRRVLARTMIFASVRCILCAIDHRFDDIWMRVGETRRIVLAPLLHWKTSDFQVPGHTRVNKNQCSNHPQHQHTHIKKVMQPSFA